MPSHGSGPRLAAAAAALELCGAAYGCAPSQDGKTPVCSSFGSDPCSNTTLGDAQASCQAGQDGTSSPCTGFTWTPANASSGGGLNSRGQACLVGCGEEPRTEPATPGSTFWDCPSTEAPTCPGNLTFLGDSQHFDISQEGIFSRVVPALERAQSAASFYDYRESSSHTGLEHVDRSLMYLYRDLSASEQNLALFWTHGIKDGRQTHAEIWGRMRGMPNGTRIVVQDDNANEFDWNSGWDWSEGWEKGTSLSHKGPYIGGKWAFASNTDGGAIDQLRTDIDWTLEVDVMFHSGAPDWDWRLYFGDGSEQELSPNRTLVIRSVAPQASNGTGAGGATGVTRLLPGQDSTFCALPFTSSKSAAIRVDFDFGDGSAPQSVWVPPGQLACAHHSYAAPGTHSVVVSAEDVACGEQYGKPLATAVVESAPSRAPSAAPTERPSAGPSARPVAGPTQGPSAAPMPGPSAPPSIGPSGGPSAAPLEGPSASPTALDSPSGAPSAPPSAPAAPSAGPASPSSPPSAGPTAPPTVPPTAAPAAAAAPTVSPASAGPPSAAPSSTPSQAPSVGRLPPSVAPSVVPSQPPSAPPHAGAAPPTAAPAPPTAAPAPLPPGAVACCWPGCTERCTVGDAQCHAADCSAVQQRCTERARDDGAYCDDGDPATVGDHCVSGVCTGTRQKPSEAPSTAPELPEEPPEDALLPGPSSAPASGSAAPGGAPSAPPAAPAGAPTAQPAAAETPTVHPAGAATPTARPGEASDTPQAAPAHGGTPEPAPIDEQGAPAAPSPADRQAAAQPGCHAACCGFDCGELPRVKDAELRLCPASGCSADWCCGADDSGSSVLLLLIAAGAGALCLSAAGYAVYRRNSRDPHGQTKGKRIRAFELDQRELSGFALDEEEEEMDMSMVSSVRRQISNPESVRGVVSPPRGGRGPADLAAPPRRKSAPAPKPTDDSSSEPID